MRKKAEGAALEAELEAASQDAQAEAEQELQALKEELQGLEEEEEALAAKLEGEQSQGEEALAAKLEEEESQGEEALKAKQEAARQAVVAMGREAGKKQGTLTGWLVPSAGGEAPQPTAPTLGDLYATRKAGALPNSMKTPEQKKKEELRRKVAALEDFARATTVKKLGSASPLASNVKSST